MNSFLNNNDITIIIIFLSVFLFGYNNYADAADFNCLNGRKIAHELPDEITTNPRFNENCLLIRMSGPIEKGDTKKFRDLIDRKIVIYILLNSPGGLLSESLELGEMIRDNLISTFIDPKSKCVSACFFVWSAGIYRSGVPFIHRPFIKDAEFSTYNAGSALDVYRNIEDILRRYLSQMGILGKLPSTFLATMLHIPPHEAAPLTDVVRNPSLIFDTFEPAIEQLLIARCGPRFRENPECIRSSLIREMIRLRD